MRILVLCTGNSARSQIAEALLRAELSGGSEVFSAGTHPKGVNPLSIQVMEEAGVDISHHTSKDVAQFQGQHFDWVITVCDNAKESCPVFPGSQMVHWSTPDPHTLEEFRSVRDQLKVRVEEFSKGKQK